MRVTLWFVFSIHLLQAQPEVGIVASVKQDSILKGAGYTFIVEAVPDIVSPLTVSDQEFESHLKQLRNLKVPVYALNIFLPGNLKLVGPSVNEAAILAYTQKVFERCHQAGIKLIVWGSGGARRVPEGFSKTEATGQFILIARKISDQAAKYGVTLALENLNSAEANLITTVAEALHVVKEVNRNNFKLCADIYHMLKEQESASVLLQTNGYLVHCDIAERDERTPPGVHGEDFLEYFKALKKANYSGKVVIECRWNNLPAQAEPARVYLRQQINKVWK